MQCFFVRYWIKQRTLDELDLTPRGGMKKT
jgi:hypothetical protein